LIGRVALFVTIAAFVALLIIFARPLSQVATAFFDGYFERAHEPKTDRATARNVVPEQSPVAADRTPVPARTSVAVAAAGSAPVNAQPQQYTTAQPQQPALQPQQSISQMQQAALRLAQPLAADQGLRKMSFVG
jgi:hypothetical protein